MKVDSDVVREREAVHTNGADQYALAVNELNKNYGKFCAVRNLTFGVRQTDCFGLLGQCECRLFGARVVAKRIAF